MKLLIWITTAMLLALWTLGVWAAAALTSWAGTAMDAGGVDLSAVVASVQLPVWLTWWFDPGWISSAIESLLWALEGVQLTLPWLGSIAGWLVVALWVMWGLGALTLLVLGGGTHWLVARSSNRTAAAT